MLIFGALVLKLAPGNFENLVCGTPAKPRSLSLSAQACHVSAGGGGHHVGDGGLHGSGQYISITKS